MEGVTCPAAFSIHRKMEAPEPRGHTPQKNQWLNAIVKCNILLM